MTAAAPLPAPERQLGHDGSDTLEDLLSASPTMPVYSRSLIYDALRACASDGELSAGERERVLAAAGRMGLAREAVAELEQQAPFASSATTSSPGQGCRRRLRCGTTARGSSPTAARRPTRSEPRAAPR